jgi:predicted metalloendopeptidase
MDPKTKGMALNKLHAIKSCVGYPDELLNEDLLEEYYRGVTMRFLPTFVIITI